MSDVAPLLGWFKNEFDMFGAQMRPHDDRYKYAKEWLDFLRMAWTEENEFDFKTESFEGPLDLLIHLIRKHEVNIYDIPIALITEQYLGYIELMQELNLDVAGEFLVMAATLIHIKSRTLLPRPDPSQDDGGQEEDPREALVRRLLEHQRYKAAADLLHDHPGGA